jgi:hypothetical protein
MTNEFKVFKCITLIKMLKKRNQPKERALEIYRPSVYKEAVKRLDKQKTIGDF